MYAVANPVVNYELPSAGPCLIPACMIGVLTALYCVVFPGGRSWHLIPIVIGAVALIRVARYFVRSYRDQRDNWKRRLKQHGLALEHAPMWVRCDWELVMYAVANHEHALNYAARSLRRDQDLKNIFSDTRGDQRSWKLIVSKKFGIAGSKTQPFAVNVIRAIQEDPFFKDNGISSDIYHPDRFSKRFCGPRCDLTSVTHPCRGKNCTKKLCTQHGVPTGRSCWRYDYYWHQVTVK